MLNDSDGRDFSHLWGPEALDLKRTHIDKTSG